MQGDSQLVIYQMLGHFTCGSEKLIPHYEDCKRIEQKLLDSGTKVWYDWVGRKQNRDADQLCHTALKAYAL